jgi:hypothetical protein
MLIQNYLVAQKKKLNSQNWLNQWILTLIQNYLVAQKKTLNSQN